MRDTTDIYMGRYKSISIYRGLLRLLGSSLTEEGSYLGLVLVYLLCIPVIRLQG